MSEPILVELAQTAQKIESLVRESDQKVLEAAALLVQAKAYFDRAEIISVSWAEWSRSAFSLARSRINELLRIGQADDPASELERQREGRRERQARHRAAALEAEAGDPERVALIGFAVNAPIEQVKFVLSAASQCQAGVADEASPAIKIPQLNQLPAVERRQHLLSGPAVRADHVPPIASGGGQPP